MKRKTVKKIAKILQHYQIVMLESGNPQQIADQLCLPIINYWIKELEKYLI